MPTPELQEFFALIQGGDDGAVEAKLREMDPFLRRVIRMRLLDGRLRRAVDTTDILQSLLKDFLRQPDAGEPARRSSAQLCAYLAAAVRHKVQTRLRKERRHAGSLPRNGNPPGPSRMSANASRTKTSPRRFAAGSMNRPVRSSTEGTGPHLARDCREVGGRADALRMRLNRAVAAVLTDLGGNG